MLYDFVPLNRETSMRRAWWSTAGSVGAVLALSTNVAAQPLGGYSEAYPPPPAYASGYYAQAPNYVLPPAYAAPYYQHSPPAAPVPQAASPYFRSVPPVYGAPTYGYRPPPAAAYAPPPVPQDLSPYYRGAPPGYVAPAYGYAHPPAAAYAPPEPVLVPLRPRSCGEYRYWNGEYCADARDEPPYLGPKW